MVAAEEAEAAAFPAPGHQHAQPQDQPCGLRRDRQSQDHQSQDHRGQDRQPQDHQCWDDRC
ncbi:MAG TPA: hypothetical protein VH479_10750 [Acidimicrobiales bacterium]